MSDWTADGVFYGMMFVVILLASVLFLLGTQMILRDPWWKRIAGLIIVLIAASMIIGLIGVSLMLKHLGHM